MTNILKVNELFSGIGSFRKALENLDISHEIVGISEIDKYAVLSYEAIFGKTRNYGDISKIKKLDYADLWTYGFPCQDISIAGNMRGIVKHKTRSGLLYEVERLLLESQKYGELPKYLILENVKNLVSRKFIADFENWLVFLEELGYKNYWKVLNAKDYGIPQNRERVFCISILNGEFNFPSRQKLNITLNDLLEHNVDKKFYLTEKQIESIKNSTFNITKTRIQTSNTCATLCARDYKDPKCVEVREKIDFVADYRYDEGLIFRKQLIIPCLTQKVGSTSLSGNPLIFIQKEIRKITPKESWRLMGFDDKSFEKAAKVCSNSQLYKQAGNSIVVNVLEMIFEELLKKDIKKGTSIKEAPNQNHNNLTIKDKLLSILTDKPQSKEILCKRLNTSERKVRRAIEELRNEGKAVVSFSTAKGYWLGSEVEKRHLIAEYKSRAYKMLNTATALELGENRDQVRLEDIWTV